MALTVIGVLLLGTAMFAMHSFLTVQDGARKHLIVAAIAVYLFAECRLYIRRTDTLGFLAPPFLASLGHFFLSYLLPTTATVADPWIQLRWVIYFQHFQAFNEQIEMTLIYAGLAAFCMWRGYYLGLNAAVRLRSLVQRSPFFRRTLEPNMLVAVAFQAGFFAVVSYAISLGVFGIAGQSENRDAHIELLYLINVALSAGYLSFFLLMCQLFRRWQAGSPAPILYTAGVGVLILHLFIAAISGFKWQLVVPFVIIALAKFLVTRRIPLVAITLGAIALFVAYQVVEPYRAYLSHNPISRGHDISTLVGALQNARADRRIGHLSDLPLGTQIISRLDLTGVSAVGIQFVDSSAAEARLKGDELAQSIYLAPVLAFVPRALWTDKPSFATGGWFNTLVLGYNDETSVGMGPIAWLYLTGGLGGLIIGFVCIGYVQALMFEGFARAGPGGFIVFLAAASSVVFIPTDIGPEFVGVMRLLPFAILAQWLILKSTLVRVK